MEAAVDAATAVAVDAVAVEAKTILVPVMHQREVSALHLATTCSTMDRRLPQIRCERHGRNSYNTLVRTTDKISATSYRTSLL